MKVYKLLFLVIIFCPLHALNLNTILSAHNNTHIKHVIIWGHLLHSHTHSYIHEAFYKAFKYLGYSTLWIDNTYPRENFDFTHCLFITEGQVDQNIPLRDDCWYILHNCDSAKYRSLFENNRCIALQVYTHKCLQDSVIKLEEYVYYNKQGKIVYMPWATNLLPPEINKNKKNVNLPKKKSAYFIGTIGEGIFGNLQQINPFKKACEENNINFIHRANINNNQSINFIKQSYMAPAIQGEWQVQEGYIPCRIFKNISYGQVGITNSETVYELFNKKIVFNADTYQLFFDAEQYLRTTSKADLLDIMNFVRDHHTYLNRIYTLFSFMNMVCSNFHPRLMR